MTDTPEIEPHELAERMVDAIIGATIDAFVDLQAGHGRFAEDAKASRATAIEIVTVALKGNSND